LLYEVKKVIVGQDHMLERIIVGLLARGHLLVEGVPGLAKTLAIKTAAGAIHGDFKRIQFTPDLVPADLVGTRIYNQKTGEFQTSLGPVFTNLLLADERMAQGLAGVAPVMTTDRLLQLQKETDRIFVDPVLMEYVVRLSTATRKPAEYGLPEIKKYITFGASPRASINLILTGRA